MNHQLNPIYQPQGLSIVAMMTFDPAVWEVSPRVYKSSAAVKKEVKESFQSQVIDKYKSHLKDWITAPALAKALGLAGAGAARATMKKDYMVAVTKTRLRKNGRAVMTEYKLK